MSESQMIKVSILSTGASQTVPIPMGYSYLRLLNKTVAQTAAPVAQSTQGAEWDPDMAQGSAIQYVKLAGTNTIANIPCLANGFTAIDSANPVSVAAVALANPSFVALDPTVWTTATAHGLIVGDIVRITSTEDAMQYAGLELSVIAVPSATTFTTLLDTTGIPVATAGNVRKLNLDVSLFYPRKRYIAAITADTSTVVRLTVLHDFKVGEYVKFIVPSAFGMTQLNGLRGKVTAVNLVVNPFNVDTSNTITVDIDSSSFDAFEFPADGIGAFTFAQVVPDGEFPQFLTAATENVGIIGVNLGSAICGTLNDEMVLYAYSADQTYSQ